jgi:hypothetical protein
MNAASIRPNHLLSYPAPAVITGIEILTGVCGDAINHEELLGTKRAAERGLNCCCRVCLRFPGPEIIRITHLDYTFQ